MAIKPVDAKLYVICPISNPVRYNSRYYLFEGFRRHLEHNKDVRLITVEMAFGERPFQIDDSPHSDILRLRSTSELWHKENMINLGFQYALQKYPGAKYLAWIDGDIEFLRKDWAQETVHQLQHYQVVQMWQDAFDLGPNLEFIRHHQSFMKGYFMEGFKYPNMKSVDGYYGGNGRSGAFAHTGYAFAARKSAINHLGGLIDFAVLGSADNNMCAALCGSVEKTFTPGLSERYKKKLLLWQERAEKHIRRNIGYVPGAIVHFWHGKKADRGYNSRSKILADFHFDPDLDLKRDAQGLWQLTDRSPGLRDALRAYSRSRSEDSIDV